MWYSYAAIVSLLTAVALSQSIASEVSQLPSCSLSCLSKAISGAGCGLTDYACQCGSAKTEIVAFSSPCFLKACSPSDALKAQSITSEVCVIQAGSGGLPSPVSSPLPLPPPPMHIELRAPVASMIGSVMPTTTAAEATTTSNVATTATSSGSASTSSPATVSTSSGDRLHVGGVLAAVAAVFVLSL